MLNHPDHWVWDFWTADDGQEHHCFYLHAPTSLGHPDRRHRAARIGRATSRDLVTWTVREPVLGPGGADSFDAHATWTGSTVLGDDGLWRTFYTGARFLHDEPVHTNVESVGVAVSADLVHWEKRPGPVTRADPRWYETLGASTWPEEAWRDPWVFRDPSGQGWHMLVTARALDGAPVDDRGVIGHATSPDLETWTVQPPLSSPGAGFGHLEVPQVVQVEGRWFLLFSCGPSTLAASSAVREVAPGTWSLPLDSPVGPYPVERAAPLTEHGWYSGRAVRQHDGTWSLLAFENPPAGRAFRGVVSDPMPLVLDDGHLHLTATATGHVAP